MSTETQNHQEWVIQERGRQARQESLDRLTALYDFPTRKHLAGSSVRHTQNSNQEVKQYGNESSDKR